MGSVASQSTGLSPTTSSPIRTLKYFALDSDNQVTHLVCLAFLHIRHTFHRHGTQVDAAVRCRTTRWFLHAVVRAHPMNDDDVVSHREIQASYIPTEQVSCGKLEQSRVVFSSWHRHAEDMMMVLLS